MVEKRQKVFGNQSKFAKFGSTSGRPGLETPVSVASLMSEAGETNPSSRQPHPHYTTAWRPQQQTDRLQTSTDNFRKNQQVVRTKRGQNVLWLRKDSFHLLKMKKNEIL